MELLLNLVWLLVCIVLFSLLEISLQRERRRGYTGQASACVRHVSALVLAFILLPVISMTDDLHYLPMMAEGERSVRAQAADSPQQQHRVRWATLFLATLPGHSTIPRCLHGTAEQPSFPLVVHLWRSPQAANRAPPISIS